jgi:hypothetical protein
MHRAQALVGFSSGCVDGGLWQKETLQEDGKVVITDITGWTLLGLCVDYLFKVDVLMLAVRHQPDTGCRLALVWQSHMSSI